MELAYGYLSYSLVRVSTIYYSLSELRAKSTLNLKEAIAIYRLQYPPYHPYVTFCYYKLISYHLWMTEFETAFNLLMQCQKEITHSENEFSKVLLLYLEVE